jgi:epoxyqueuosine reductase
VNIQLSNPSEASAAIKRKALELGFSQAGIVPAEPLAEAEARLRQWLARGFHSEMKWMERDPSQRADPRKIFPDARSVLVVTMNYYTAHEHEERAHGGSDRVNA